MHIWQSNITQQREVEFRGRENNIGPFLPYSAPQIIDWLSLHLTVFDISMQFLYIASYCAFSYGLILNCIYAKILHSVKTALPPYYLEIIGGTDKKKTRWQVPYVIIDIMTTCLLGQNLSTHQGKMHVSMRLHWTWCASL